MFRKKELGLWSIFSILLTVIGAGGFYLITALQKNELNNFTQDLETQIRFIAKAAEKIQMDSIEDISYLGEMKIFQKEPSQNIRKLLKRYFSKHKFIISNITWRTKEKTLLNIDLSGQNYYNFSLKPAAPLSAIPYLKLNGYGAVETNGQEKLFFIKPVRNKTKVISNLTVFCSLEKFFRYIMSVTPLTRFTQLWVIDFKKYNQTNTFLLPSDNSFSQVDSNFKKFLEEAKNGFKGTGKFINIIDKGSGKKEAAEFISAYYPLEIMKKKYCIGISANKDDVLRNIRQTNLIVGFLSTLAIAILTGFFMIFLSKEKTAARIQMRMQNQLQEYAGNLEIMVEERTRELKEKEGQLIQSSKLASLGEMATGIAHEINQPLNVIKMITTGMLHFLKKGKTLPEEMLQEELTTTDGQIERMRKIINHLRSFSRKSSEIVTEEVDINIPLNDSLGFVKQQLMAHEIKIATDIAGSLPKVMADANKIEQVFLNIFNNARDAMDERAAGEHGKLLKICSFTEKDQVFVTISDTGGGIPEHTREKIFEPFYTTKEVGKGTGLGMSISYNIIKDFKGSLNFEVEEGVGTTFKVAMPSK